MEGRTCISCTRPAAPHRRRCPPCGESSRASSARYRTRNLNRARDRDRAWRERLKAAHLCIKCGQAKAAPGGVRCPRCLESQRQDTNSRRASRAQMGACKECGHPAEGKAHCPSCRRRINARARALREEVLNAYGGRCACCGEREPCFLHIDHINNDGYSHRKTVSRCSTSMYRWLKQRGFPRDGYQLLCANCNFGRFLNGGICPHQRKEGKAA
jgi:hypothetical protein